MDDELTFVDEDEEAAAAAPTKPPIKVLLVDDDELVHRASGMILSRINYHGAPLEVLDALSGAEARQMIRENPDIALILLDVVMETDHEGLDVVKYIRDRLGNRTVQIMLCTGQAGSSDEREVVTKYMVNAYSEKPSLTFDRMYSKVYTLLNNYTLTQEALGAG